MEEKNTEGATHREEEVPKTEGLVSRAEAAAQRMEEANARMEAHLARVEAMRVEERLGGKSSTQVPEKEETPEEYAKKVMSGGFDESN